MTESDIENTSRPSAAKPGSVLLRLLKRRTSHPAPAANATASAISANRQQLGMTLMLVFAAAAIARGQASGILCKAPGATIH